MEPTMRKDPYKITKMPSKKLLEDYLRKEGKVSFNIEKGIFERTG